MPTLSDWDNWIEQSKAKFAPYEVPIEEREQAIDEGEVGQYPGDDPEKFLKSGRKEFAKLKSDRLALTDQVKKARAKEKELHPYPKMERAFSAITGSVPSFLSPDVPQEQHGMTPDTVGAPQPVTSITPPSRQPIPQPKAAGSRFALDNGSIIDTKRQEPVTRDQFEMLANPRERDEIDRQMQSAAQVPALSTAAPSEPSRSSLPIPPVNQALESMLKKVNRRSAELDRDRNGLDAMQAQMDALEPKLQIRTGQQPVMTDEARAQHDAIRQTFNQKVDAFNQKRNEFNALVKKYNRAVGDHARKQVTPQIRPTINRFGSSMDFSTPDTLPASDGKSASIQFTDRAGNPTRTVTTTAPASTPSAMELGREFGRGVRRGVSQTGALLVGGASALAGAVGARDTADTWMKTYDALQKDAAAYPSSVSWDQALSSPGAFLSYSAGALGEQVPVMASVVATGGVGSLVGRLIGKGIINRAAGQAAIQAADKWALHGGFSGAAAAGSALEAGGIYGEQREAGLEPSPKTALVGGAVSGILESAVPYALARAAGLGPAFTSTFMRTLQQKGLLTRMASLGAGAAVGEGATEAAQEAVAIAARRFVDRNYDALGPEVSNRILQSAVTGAIVGGPFGSMAGVSKPRNVHASESQFQPEPKRLDVGALRETPLRFPVQQVPTPDQLVQSIPQELTISPRSPFLVKRTPTAIQASVTPESVVPSVVQPAIQQERAADPGITQPPAPHVMPEPMGREPLVMNPAQQAMATEVPATPDEVARQPNIVQEQAIHAAPIQVEPEPREPHVIQEPIVSTGRISEQAGPSTDEIHRLAERKGIPWDNNHQFMDLTEAVTGKRHLDDLTDPERSAMMQAIEAQPTRPTRPYVPGDPIATDTRAESLPAKPVDTSRETPTHPLAAVERMYRDIMDDSKAVFHMKREQRDDWQVVKRIDKVMQDGLRNGLDYGQAVQRVNPKDLELLEEMLANREQKVSPREPILTPDTVATPAVIQKEPGQMTALGYARSRVPASIRDKITAPQRSFEAQHRKEIVEAMRRGESVPPEVLADYPDLQKQQPSTSGVEQAEIPESPAVDPAQLAFAKKGSAVGFNRHGNTITMGYLPKSKSYTVEIATPSGTALSSQRFGTERDARANAASKIDRDKTRELAWWDVSQLVGRGTSTQIQKKEKSATPDAMPVKGEAKRQVGETPDEVVTDTKQAPTPDEVMTVGQRAALTTEQHKAFMRRLYDGEVSLDEYKKAFQHVLDSKDALTTELSGMTKEQLIKLVGMRASRSENKAGLVRQAYDSLLADFSIGRGVSYMMTGGKDGYDRALTALVNKTTEQDLKQFSETVAKQRADRKARIEGLKNPQTLEDFETRVRVKGESSLSPEQLARYDELLAQAGRERRKQAQERQSVVQGVDAGADVQLIESKHTKTGEPLWVVKLANRVDRAVYDLLNQAAHKLGGRYSSYNKDGAVPGFTFRSKDAANSFMAAAKGESVSSAPVQEATKPQVQHNAVANLREMADRLDGNADEILNADRKTNTARRARMASNTENAAYGDKAQAATMRNLADAIESGEATHLSGLRTKAQVEMLDVFTERAKFDRDRKRFKDYSEQDKQRHRKAEPEDAAHADFPDFDLLKDHVMDVIRDLTPIKGTERIRLNLAKAMNRVSDGERVPIGRDLAESAMAKYPKDSRTVPPWQWTEARANLKRLESMGITSLPELRAALREFVQYRGKRDTIDKATQLERNLIGRKDIGNDFFPTPRAMADRMVREADIRPGMKVLEPSAGNGNIAESIKAAGVDPDVAESSSALRDILEAKGFNVVGQDFLDVKEGVYDRIIMNPPFSNGQDADHIQHAYSLLKPGGKLVAIAGEGVFFRNDAKATAFRNWLHEVGGTEEKLPPGTFNDPALMATTGANARIVTIRRLSGKGISRAEDHPVNPATSSSDPKITELGAPDRDANAVPRGTEPSSSSKELADLFRQESADLYRKKSPKVPRIPVAPITGGPSVPLGDMILNLEKGTGKKLMVGKTKGGTAGVYKPGSSATIIKYSGDLDTTAHEMSHALDDRYGLVKEWNGQDTSPFDTELEPFSHHGSPGNNTSPTYNRAEGVAEYLRAWLVNPDAAEAAAPKFTAHMKSKLPAEIQKALKTFSTQVRQWSGHTAHAKIMSNVQWETPETGLTHWLTGTRAAKGPGFQLTFGDQLSTVWTDRLAPFMKALKYVREQRGHEKEELLPGNDPALLSRLFMGVNAKLDDIFSHGMVDSRLERATPGGLSWLLEPLDQSSSKSLEDSMQEVASLMIAQRTIEKSEQLGKKRVSGIGAGIEDDVSVAEARLAELKKDEARYAKLKEAASRYRQWADANLRYLVDKGRLSQEQYEGIKANNEQYVAMQRILEVSPGEELVTSIPRGGPGRKIGSVGTPVQTFKGSTRAIKNPYLSLMDATHRSIREADRNEILKLFRDLLTTDRGLYEGEPNNLATVGREARAGEQHTIPIFVNGEKKVWQFHPDIYKALKGIEEGEYKLPPVLTVLPRILRATIVNAPPFALRNIIRDAWHRSIVSLAGSKPWDTLKVYSKDEISQLKRSGGDQAGHYYTDAKNYARAMKFAMEEAVASHNSIVVNPAKLMTWAKKGAQGYLDLMQGSERQGRLSEYRRAFAKAKRAFGYDDYHAMLYAASQSRSLIDYAIAGNWMLLMNQMIPFSNAAVQGLRSSALRAKADPAGYALRFGAFALAPTLMTYAWNYLYGDDDLDEYRQLPAYQRDLFWNFKLGPDLWLKVPKPFENGVMASSFERMLDYAMGNPKAFDGHVGSMAKTLLPVDEASFAGPYQAIFQAAANYDFFRDRPIVPRWEENLALDLRSYHRASRLGQALQQAIGVDARKIDFVIQQQFGYLGRYASDISDTGRKDKHGLTLSASGLTGGSPASVSLDAKEVSRIAEERGVVPSRSKAVERITNMAQITPRNAKHPDSLRYAVFRKHLNEYYKAESREDRDRLAKQVRADAKHLLDLWEKQPPRPEADDKIKKKRAHESEYDPFLDLIGVPQPTSKHPATMLHEMVP